MYNPLKNAVNVLEIKEFKIEEESLNSNINNNVKYNISLNTDELNFKFENGQLKDKYIYFDTYRILLESDKIKLIKVLNFFNSK